MMLKGAKLLNKDEIKGEILKIFLETNKNINTTYQNLWDIAKAVLRRKFTDIHAYIKKQKAYQINNLTLCIKDLEKKEQTELKVSRR